MAHRHEWYTHEGYRWFHCDCGHILNADEIARRLIATECLSAKDASLMKFVLMENQKLFYASEARQDLRHKLLAYARALEPKII